jgi:hypothetical protein
MDFVVPLHPEDLELPRQGQGRIYVQTVFDVEGCADIDAVIDGACGGRPSFPPFPNGTTTN